MPVTARVRLEDASSLVPSSVSVASGSAEVRIVQVPIFRTMGGTVAGQFVAMALDEVAEAKQRGSFRVHVLRQALTIGGFAIVVAYSVASIHVVVAEAGHGLALGLLAPVSAMLFLVVGVTLGSRNFGQQPYLERRGVVSIHNLDEAACAEWRQLNGDRLSADG